MMCLFTIHIISFFAEVSVYIFLFILHWIGCFLIDFWVFYIFWIQALYQIWICKYLLSVCCSSYILLTNLWRSGVLIKSDLSILLWNYTFDVIPNLCLAQDHKDFFPKSYKTCRKTIKEYKTIKSFILLFGTSTLS